MLTVIHRSYWLTFLRSHFTMTGVRFFLGVALLAAAGIELATNLGTINALALSGVAGAAGVVVALYVANDAHVD